MVFLLFFLPALLIHVSVYFCDLGVENAIPLSDSLFYE
jgi:hypothetical protein